VQRKIACVCLQRREGTKLGLLLSVTHWGHGSEGSTCKAVNLGLDRLWRVQVLGKGEWILLGRLLHLEQGLHHGQLIVLWKARLNLLHTGHHLLKFHELKHLAGLISDWWLVEHSKRARVASVMAACSAVGTDAVVVLNLIDLDIQV